MKYDVDKKKMQKKKSELFCFSLVYGLVLGGFVVLIIELLNWNTNKIFIMLSAELFSLIGFCIQIPIQTLRFTQRVEISDKSIAYNIYYDKYHNPPKDIIIYWTKVIAIDCKPVKLLRRNEMLQIRTENDEIYIEDIFTDYALMKNELLELCEKYPRIEIDKMTYKSID